MPGLALGGGSNPSRTHAVKAVNRARIVQICGFGFGCCWQLPKGGRAASGSGAGECCVLAMM
jgi:hypothetical protein